VGYANGLIIVSAAGGLWYHDLRSNGRTTTTTTLIATAAETGTGGHGLALDGNRLYIAHGGAQKNTISIHDLTYNDDDDDEQTARATRVGSIESPLLDSPTSLAQSGGGMLYIANARLDSLPFPSPKEGNLTLFREQFTVVAIETSDIVS
jgi:hypothetical protein